MVEGAGVQDAQETENDQTKSKAKNVLKNAVGPKQVAARAWAQGVDANVASAVKIFRRARNNIKSKENASLVDTTASQKLFVSVHSDVMTDERRTADAMRTEVWKVMANELVKDTGAIPHFERAVGALGRAMGTLAACIKEAGALSSEYAPLGADDSPDDKLRIRFERFSLDAVDASKSYNQATTDAVEDCKKAMSDQLVRARIHACPDKTRKDLVHALEGADQGIHFVQKVGEVLSAIPEQHVQVASRVIVGAGAGMEAGKVIADRTIKEGDNLRQMKNFRAENVAGTEYVLADGNRLMVAKMLADSRLGEARDLVVAQVKPLFVVADGFTPTAGFPVLDNITPSAAFDLVSSSALTFIEVYQAQRIRLAVVRLRAEGRPLSAEEEEIAEEYAKKEFGHEFIENLKGGLRSNVFSALDPLGTVATAFRDSVAKKVSELLVDKIDVPDAELVSGVGVENAGKRIADAQHGHLRFKDTSTVRVELPTEDADGRPVQQILSELTDAETDDGESYWIAKVANRVGRLHHPSLRFEAGIADEDNYLNIPTTGYFGGFHPVKFDQVVLDRTEHDDQGKPKRYRVRYKEIWGWVDAGGKHTFHPGELDEASVANWADRFVDKAGWRPVASRGDMGTEVKGTWHLPRPNDYKDHFLFVGDDGTFEWARGFSRVGNGVMIWELLTTKPMVDMVKPGFPDSFFRR